MYDLRIQPPANGRPLKVMIVGRVSRETQDIHNIEAGAAYVEKHLRMLYDGQYELTIFGEQGSGMLTNRPEIRRAIKAIESRLFDVVMAEDIGRAFRNQKFLTDFVYCCVDHSVRLIVPGDGLDTARQDWHSLMSAAALKHGLMIDDTKRRINRTADYKFEGGGEVRKVGLGYNKLTKEQAESVEADSKGLRLAKDPRWTIWLTHIRNELIAGTSSISQLVAWLNEQGATPTKYAKTNKISNRHLLSLLRSPLLYGLREFRKVRSRYLFRSGEYRREKNESPMQKLWPELAHMTKVEWEQLQQAMDKLQQFERRRGADHPRHHVPRRRSVLPNQLMTCSICGGLYYPAGKDVLKCMNSRADAPTQCWHHTQVNASRARALIVDLLIEIVESSDESREALKAAAWREVERVRKSSGGELEEVERALAEVNLQSQRIASAIKSGADLDVFVQELATLKQKISDLKKRKAALASRAASEQLPKSREQLDFDLRLTLIELASASFDFADLIRRVIRKFEIQPVQALDTGQVRPRAFVVIDLSARAPNGGSPQQTPRELTVDLFDPPVHIRFLKAIVDARATLKLAGKRGGYDAIASATGQGRMTIKRALAYDRLMVAHETSDPFIPLQQPPERASRWTQRGKLISGVTTGGLRFPEVPESEFSDGMPAQGGGRISESAA